MRPADRLLGALEVLILKTLEAGPNHGFGITLYVETASGGLLHMEEGSLYPALHRMEKLKFIQGEWRRTESGRRARFYSLTPSGQNRLAAAQEQWSAVSLGVQRVLRFA